MEFDHVRPIDNDKFSGKWNANKLPQLCITLELLMTGRWDKPSSLKLVSFLLFLLLPLPLTMLQSRKWLMSKQSQHSKSVVIYSSVINQQYLENVTILQTSNKEQPGDQKLMAIVSMLKNTENKSNYERFFWLEGQLQNVALLYVLSRATSYSPWLYTKQSILLSTYGILLQDTVELF